MNETTEKRIPAAVWFVTGLVAVALAAITIAFAVTAVGQAGLGVEVYLTNPTGLVQLHAAPSNYSTSIAILGDGATAIVRQIRSIGDETWYLVEAEAAAGWVNESRISTDPP
jgi:hypothetical protein